MAENFKKNIGTLRCEEARSYYSKNNIWQKLILKTHFYVSTGKFSAFLRKIQNFEILFGLWAKNFRQGFQNCILRVQKKNILGRENIGKSL